MLYRRTYAVAILVGLILGGLVVIQVASLFDVGGVSKVVRPAEAGVGTRCAEGDQNACRKLCVALSDVSTLTCIHHLAEAFPVTRGGGSSSGVSSSPSIPAPSPNGGGDSGPQGSPLGPPGLPEPPGASPPTTSSPPPADPSPADPVEPITRLVCNLDLLGNRVCVRVRVN